MWWYRQGAGGYIDWWQTIMEEAGLSSTKPLYYDFICEQPHASVQFFKALSESTCVLFRRALLLRSDKRWTKLPNAAHNGDLEVHFEKRVITVHGACGGGGHWLPSHHHLPIIVPTNTTIADPIFHHYFTKVFPPKAKRCTVMFSWWNIIWSTNWRVFTLPEILRLASFFLFRI